MQGAPITEVDVVTELVAISSSDFAYALRNGTVGVYKFVPGSGSVSGSASGSSGAAWAQRVWRMASKNRVRSLKTIAAPDKLGVNHLVLGWGNGSSVLA